MHIEDRPIHFSVELIHAPVPIHKETLQRFYSELLGSSVSYDSIDTTFPMQVRFYSTRGNRSQSILLFLPDRILIIEEWVSITFDEYLHKVTELSPKLFSIRNQMVFLAHTCTIRSTLALTNYDDSKNFILEKFINHSSNIIFDYFGRPVATAGIRLVFPESNETPGIYHLLIESFRHSKKEVFVEIRGIYGRAPVTIQNTHILAEHLKELRYFLTQRVQPFLAKRDE